MESPCPRGVTRLIELRPVALVKASESPECNRNEPNGEEQAHDHVAENGEISFQDQLAPAAVPMEQAIKTCSHSIVPMSRATATETPVRATLWNILRHGFTKAQ